MKPAIKSITAFLLLNVVASAPMYYIYDEKPDGEYGTAIGSTGSYKNRLNNHKKYFIGSNNQKYMKLVNERAVDSHFTVQKTPSKPYGISEDGKIIEIGEVARYSQSYRRAKEDSKPNERENYVSASTNNDLEGTNQDSHKTTIPDNQSNTSLQNLHKYNQREYLQNGDNVYDKKHNFVSVNAHKTAVSKDQRVVMKSSSQQFIYQPQGHHHHHQQGHHQLRTSGAAVKDKSLHKSAVANERNTQVALPKKPDSEHTQMVPQNTKGITQKSDSNSRRMDSKKRDTVNIQPSNSDNNSRSTSVSDNMRKYIHKDVNNHKEYKNNVIPSRIGNHEERVEVNETPYALFYRTNSEHLDDQEALIENPLAEPTNSAYHDKMTWNIESESQGDTVNTKSKRAPNVKIHKKVKNHTSYRNR